jgi:hypothetical protein
MAYDPHSHLAILNSMNIAGYVRLFPGADYDRHSPLNARRRIMRNCSNPSMALRDILHMPNRQVDLRGEADIKGAVRTGWIGCD